MRNLKHMQSNFQRKDSKSNAHAGKLFELQILDFFNETYNLELIENIKVPVGISTQTERKLKAFDLGKVGEVVVECKSHKWTETENAPSAKMATWNEAMFYFHLVPVGYRKIFVVEKSLNSKRNITLAKYYLNTHGHLIPDDVEIWEFCSIEMNGNRIK